MDVVLVMSSKNVILHGVSIRNVEEHDHVINNKVTATLESLYNGDNDAISAAIIRLGFLGGERALEGLTSVVSSKGRYLNHHADAIEQIVTISAPREKKVESLIRCSGYAVFSEVRDQALEALSEVGGDEAFDFLKKCLWYKSAIESVLKFGEEYREPLVEVSLSTIRSPIGVSNHPPPGQWKGAPYPISSRDKSPLENILEYANHRYWWRYEYERRDGACRVMRELGEDEVVVEECYKLLQNPDASVRHSAVYCLGRATPKAATIEMLQEIWGKDDNQIVRYCACLSLVQIVGSRGSLVSDNNLNNLPQWPFEIRRMALLAILDRDNEDRLWLSILRQHYTDSIMEEMDELEPSWRS